IWVGLLEDIQNIASHRSFGPDIFRLWLGPQSLIAWDEVNRGMQKVAEWAAQNRRHDQHPQGGGNIDVEAAYPRLRVQNSAGSSNRCTGKCGDLSHKRVDLKGIIRAPGVLLKT